MKQICTVCRKEKPMDEFYRNKRKKNGYETQCKRCQYSRTKERKKIYSVQYELSHRGRRYKEKYAISIEDYNRMVIQQKHRCAICETHISEMSIRLNIDHNHKTGNIRGLLCNKCNSMLGFARDNPVILNSAIGYLKNDKYPFILPLHDQSKK